MMSLNYFNFELHTHKTVATTIIKINNKINIQYVFF